MPTWKFTSTMNPSHTRVDELHLAWEVPGAAAIDVDAEPDDDPLRLFEQWIRLLLTKPAWAKGIVLPNLPIYWFARGTATDTVEQAPFARNWSSEETVDAPRRTFLTHYTWPEEVTSGERVSWTSMPVVNAKTSFITKALGGWQPSPLQELMNVDRLAQAAGCAPIRPA